MLFRSRKNYLTLPLHLASVSVVPRSDFTKLTDFTISDQPDKELQESIASLLALNSSPSADEPHLALDLAICNYRQGILGLHEMSLFTRPFLDVKGRITLKPTNKVLATARSKRKMSLITQALAGYDLTNGFHYRNNEKYLELQTEALLDVLSKLRDKISS